MCQYFSFSSRRAPLIATVAVTIAEIYDSRSPSPPPPPPLFLGTFGVAVPAECDTSSFLFSRILFVPIAIELFILGPPAGVAFLDFLLGLDFVSSSDPLSAPYFSKKSLVGLTFATALRAAADSISSSVGSPVLREVTIFSTIPGKSG
jgi:hypothetical protein